MSVTGRSRRPPGLRKPASRGRARQDERGRDDDATVSPSQRAEFLALVEAANREPSPEEAARIEAAWNRQLELRTAHPLSVAAREYADIAANVTAIIRLVLEARGDAVALAAVDTIERFAYFLAIKTWRAAGGLVSARLVGSSSDDGDEDDIDDENRPANLQSDSNGCAKLVRLVIAESRDAWQVLMQPGIATADGVPAAMARRLDELDAAVATAFPRAMEFVRMGFDEDL